MDKIKKQALINTLKYLGIALVALTFFIAAFIVGGALGIILFVSPIVALVTYCVYLMEIEFLKWTSRRE